ncbi:MAG: TolC family protein [Pseudomonadota bacterium]
MRRPSRYRLGAAAQIIALIVLFCAPSLAADVLTWEDCVKEAAKQNLDIRSAKETLEASKYGVKAAYSGFFPTVTGNASYSKGNSFSFSEQTGNPSDTQNKSVSASVSASENIFAGFRDKALVAQGKANKDASSAALDTTKVTVSFNLKSSFAGLLYAQNYLKLSESIIQRRSENARMVELRYDSGVENKGSYLLAKAFLSQAHLEKTLARDAISVSREQLAVVMGLPRYTSLNIRGPAPTHSPPSEPDFKAISMGVPDLSKAIAQEQASKAGVKLARSNFFPNLSAVGTVSSQGQGWTPDNGRNSVGLNMSLPVFTGGKDYFNYKTAGASYAAASYQRDSVEIGLIPKLKDAYNKYVEAVERLEVDRAFVEAAEVRAEIARSKYNNGLMSFEDWDIIENDLITKQKTFLQSQRDRVTAEGAWEQAQGKGEIQ